MNTLRSQLFRTIGIPSRRTLKSIAFSTAFTTVSTGTITFCESGGGGKDNDKDLFTKIQKIVTRTSSSNGNSNNIDLDAIGKILGSNVQEVIDSGVPTQISYGFVCGYSSGYALKKIGKVASVVLGLGFMTLQSLAYAGYIEVNHNDLKKNVEKVLDINQDGKIDGADATILYDKLMEILEFNMTGVSGFAAGFLGGFKSG